MTLATLQDSVFQVAELLECILSHLPAKKIFAVQCVSQAWKKAISQSPSIQRKLFFRLDGGPKETWELVDPKLENVLPIERYAIDHTGRYQPPIIKNGERFRLVEITQQDYNRLILPISLNPLLQERLRKHTCLERILCWHSSPTTLRDLASGMDAHYHGTIVTLAQLSETFLSDPPCHRAKIKFRELLKDPASVPTGEVYEAELDDIIIESASGLKIQDIERAIYDGRGKSFGFTPFLDVPEWDNLELLQAGLTRVDVHAIIKKKLGWRDVASEPQIDVFVDLVFDEGPCRLFAVVPTALDRALLFIG
jgi:hypothetical protein